ncbi:hypothetical protein BGZ68_006526 [Mortierella alpina]|nr:hypothetical protein BGZ68_006526 [Mortierella alpina]
MSIARIRSGVSASVVTKASVGTPFCAHRDPAQQWLQLMFLHSSQRASITRSSQSVARASFSQRSLHSNATAKRTTTRNITRDQSAPAKDLWEIPTSTQTSSALLGQRNQQSRSKDTRHDTHFKKQTSSAPGKSRPYTGSSFIPEATAWDVNADYWKLYQAQLDNKATVKDIELSRLGQWLSSNANKGVMNKELATKLTMVMKELHRRPKVLVSNDHYNDLIHYHIKRTKYQEAQRIVDLMAEERRFKKGAKVTLNPRTLALLMAMHLKTGNESQLRALTSLDQNTEMDRLFVAQFLKWSRGLQLTSEHIDQAKRILREIQTQSCPPNSKMFTGRLGAHFGKKRYEEALALLNHTLDLGFPANEYTSSFVVSELLKAKRYDDVIQVWTRIREHPESKVTTSLHNSVLSALCQEPRRFAETQTMWNWMLKESNLKPDLYSFSIMLGGCFRAKDLTSAMSLWDAMQQEPYCITPTPTLYNVALMGLFYNHKPELALKLYRQMVDMEQEGSKPDRLQIPLETYNIMIRGLLSVQDLEGLNKVFAQMEHTKTQPDATTYTTITDILFSQRDKESANKVMELMLSRNIHKTAITYSAVIAGLANVGDLGRAQTVYKEMQEAGLQPSVHTYGALIQGALRAGDVTLAEEMALLAKTRTEEGLSLGAYSILVSGYANLAMIDHAERWFIEMQQALPRLRNDGTSSSTITTTNGDKTTSVAGGVDISVSENRSSIPWNVYYVMLKACVELRLWAPAERVLATMTALKFQSQVPKLTVLIREVERERAKQALSRSAEQIYK